ncbi:MAG: hypothetical protein MHPSP_004472, partial [Paramarteilia canceri]
MLQSFLHETNPQEAEVAIDWMINLLKNMPNEYSQTLCRFLETCITERRTENSDMICFLSLIDNKIPESSLKFFEKPSKETRR